MQTRSGNSSTVMLPPAKRRTVLAQARGNKYSRTSRRSTGPRFSPGNEFNKTKAAFTTALDFKHAKFAVKFAQVATIKLSRAVLFLNMCVCVCVCAHVCTYSL